MTQIPESRTHVKALKMVVAGGDLKTDTLQTEGAVGAALGAIHLSREGYFEFGTAWTSPAHVAVAEITMQRSLAQFGVHGPIDFHLDPGLRGFIWQTLSRCRARDHAESSVAADSAAGDAVLAGNVASGSDHLVAYCHSLG